MPGWEVRTLTVKQLLLLTVSFPAPGKGTLEIIWQHPHKNTKERSGPLSRHSLNVCHQAALAEVPTLSLLSLSIISGRVC